MTATDRNSHPPLRSASRGLMAVVLLSLLLLVGCESGPRMTYNRMQRATTVTSDDLSLSDTDGPMSLTMSYGSAGKVVRKPQRIRLQFEWEAGTFLPDYAELVLRGNVRSSATRMSSAWDITATVGIPLETLRVILPMGSKEGATGSILGVTFKLDERFARNLDEMLAFAGAELD